MSQDAMNIDQTQTQSKSLTATTNSLLSSSLSNLSISSKAIPSNKDFHFYNNFDEFKHPIQEIETKTLSLLQSVGVSNKKFAFPNDPDTDDNYDWLVNVNDEFLERFDASFDEFQSIRKKLEEKGGVLGMEDDNESGFQTVYGKKKKGLAKFGTGSSIGGSVSESGVKVADLKAKGVKAKIPFHIPTIKKPQEQYNMLVNNSNVPFEHVWLQRSEDGLRFVHPLENLSTLDFVDSSTGNGEPEFPPPVESTPFKLVEEVKDLKALAAKLRGVNEFAVDLEHNQYRSFQGLTCLMQISTRTEDFIIDTLKLRIHVGPYLREVFKDPTKRKVLHGADRDIIWLQRDFGIYVCNMFDTGQASRVLKLERNSLEYLLQHFCGITANKEYQNADWRLRPLTKEMLRYARDDTHYLLYIYDKMRVMLLSTPSETETSESLLVEVYKRSYGVCMQLYEKELLTESSYLHMYGLQSAGFNAQQLAIVAGLFEWRDVIARTEDESTGFILPNKVLLEIAKQMPVTPQKLRRVLNSKHPYIERNLASVVNVIRHAMQNSAEFEAVAQRLKEERIETVPQENTEVNDDIDTNLETADTGTETNDDDNAMDSLQLEKDPLDAELAGDGQGYASKTGQNGIGTSNILELPEESPPILSMKRDTTTSMGFDSSAMVPKATVQVLKKPTGAFGALLGNSAGKRRFDIDKKEKEDNKLDKIRSSVNLPFHSFAGGNEPAKPVVEEPNLVGKTQIPEESSANAVASSSLEDIIPLENNSDREGEENVDSETKDAQRDGKSVGGSESETDEEEGKPTSLADLSTSFRECFQSNNNQNRTNEIAAKSDDPTGLRLLKPFDYAAARKEVKFGEESREASDKDESKHDSALDRRKSNVIGGVEKDDKANDFQQGKRRQAFPATGNRSATFR